MALSGGKIHQTSFADQINPFAAGKT
jgi:hypothetical protein